MTKNSFYINSLTGDYVIENGDIQQQPVQMTQVYQRIKTERKNWLYAPDDNYGSDLYRVEQDKGFANTPLAVEKILYKAVYPMVANGDLLSLSVNYLGTNAEGVWLFKITGQLPSGDPFLYYYPPNEVINAG